MKNNYIFRISDLLLQVESDKALQVPKCFQAFEGTSDKHGHKDILVEIVHSTEGIHIEQDDLKLAPEIYYRDHTIITRYMMNGDRAIFRREVVGEGWTCRIYLPESFSDTFCKQGYWQNYFQIERLLAPYHRFFLHASVVMYKGKGYLFTAPSSGGKSTHAKLWEEYFGATIINGDKALISVSAEGSTVYGGPAAGSSQIYRNESAQIAAIFVIEKSDHNCVSLLPPTKAFLSLYSHAIKSKWDTDYNRQVLEMTEILQKKIPVYKLECLPEKSAVECILQTLGEAYEA